MVEDINGKLYKYKGNVYPSYLLKWNAMAHIMEIAKHFCTGHGLDIGAGKNPLPNAFPIDIDGGYNAYNLPLGPYDYIFSSHCLEHLDNPVKALEIWKDHIKPGGCLFLYLPHPDMIYWRPQHNRKHLHTFHPADIVQLLFDLDFVNVIGSQRDMYWSYTVVGFKK